jgi:hypothetical protein
MTPAKKRASAAPRRRFHFIIAIQWGIRDPDTCTSTGTVAPLPGTTREDMFDFLYARTVREAGATDAHVMFFALEPNDL